MSQTFFQIGKHIGALVEDKNHAYGNSFAKAGSFLRLLFPNGLAPHQYDDALLQVRIFDKQMRIATDRDALGENPYQDIAGYGILGVALHQLPQPEETPAPCNTNAPAPAASTSPREATASAARSAAKASTLPTSTRRDRPSATASNDAPRAASSTPGKRR